MASGSLLLSVLVRVLVRCQKDNRHGGSQWTWVVGGRGFAYGFKERASERLSTTPWRECNVAAFTGWASAAALQWKLNRGLQISKLGPLQTFGGQTPDPKAMVCARVQRPKYRPRLAGLTLVFHHRPKSRGENDPRNGERCHRQTGTEIKQKFTPPILFEGG